jgi:uncharacterized cofD-like protein
MLTTLPDRRHARVPESLAPVRRLVALGGGTGLPAVLRSLRLLSDQSLPGGITAIVAVSDDGGSSGALRRQLAMVAPGDARNCVAALAAHDSPLAAVLQKRIPCATAEGEHPVGNLVLAALTQQMNGDFAAAVDALSKMVDAGGRVLPATSANVGLRAEFESGEIVTGETAIAAKRQKIHRLSLDRPALPLPDAVAALVNADAIIVGPGSLYTSILPVLLVAGVAPTIYGLRATRIYVSNLMTEPGETDGMTLEDHLDVIEHHVGGQLFDYVLVNSRPVPPMSLERYAHEAAYPVRRRTTAPTYRLARIVEHDLAWQHTDGKIRHDPAALALAIRELVSGTPTPLTSIDA